LTLGDGTDTFSRNVGRRRQTF